MVRFSSLLLAGLSFVPARVLGALQVNLDDNGNNPLPPIPVPRNVREPGET
jgi:hypothetical protein